MNDERKYVRLYYSVIDDPKFEAVYGDDAAWAAYTRLLMLADSMWPASPPIPKSCKPTAFRKLVDETIVDVLPGGKYRIHGLDAERVLRSKGASQNATLRWSRPKGEGGKPASRSVRFKVLERDGFRCRYCGRSSEEVALDVDHVVPVREGGKPDLDNLVTACVDCNAGKSGHALRAQDNDDARASADLMLAKPSLAEPSKAEHSRAESEQDDPVQTYYLLTTRAPRGRALDWCKRLGDEYGYRAASDAMADAWGQSDEVGTLLSRTENLLVLAARNAERQERAAELAALRRKRERRAVEAQVPPSEMTEEEIAAEIERYRSGGTDDA
jgi:hypothetical protein